MDVVRGAKHRSTLSDVARLSLASNTYHKGSLSMSQDLNDKIPAYDENMNMDDFNMDNFQYQQQGYENEIEQPLGPMTMMMEQEKDISSQSLHRNRNTYNDVGMDSQMEQQAAEDELNAHTQKNMNTDTLKKKNKAISKKKKVIGNKSIDSSRVVDKKIELTNQEIKKYLDDTSGICRVSNRQARKNNSINNIENNEWDLKHVENYFEDVYDCKYSNQVEVDQTWSKRGGNIPGKYMQLCNFYQLTLYVLLYLLLMYRIM